MSHGKTEPVASSSCLDPDAALSEASIARALREQAERTPTRIALIESSAEGTTSATIAPRSMTYHDLREASERAARGLLASAQPGDRVALWGPNSIDWIVIEYAVACSGLVLVPLNPALTRAEAADLIGRSGAVIVIAANEFRGRSLLEEAHVISHTLPRVHRVLDLSSATQELGSSHPAELADPPSQNPFLIQYTSGTTGAPKGAVLTQHTALNIGVMTLPVLGVGDGAVWVNPLPLHHVGASVCGVFSALASGGTFVTVATFDPEEVLRLIERTKATVLGAVPTTLVAMLDLPTLKHTDVSSLQVVQVGGSTVAPSLIARAEATLGARVVNAYGQSEAPSATQTRLGDNDATKATTIGRPGLHREARIISPVTGKTLPEGEPGELCLRSPLMMTGYFDDPERTAEVIDADGWLRTGDLCSLDAEGNLTIHGRLRDVIIRGGENIYPAEVEDALMKHPAVADIAVIGAPDPRWGERVVAFVRFRPHARVDWAALETHARGLLAGFKCPREWHEVEEFPLTPSGKVQKFRLQERLQ